MAAEGAEFEVGEVQAAGAVGGCPSTAARQRREEQGEEQEHVPALQQQGSIETQQAAAGLSEPTICEGLQRRAEALQSTLRRAVATGKQLKDADLQPSLTAYNKLCKELLGELAKAHTALQQLESVAAVGDRDAALLKATLALRSPEQQSERAQLEAGLRGIQQFTAKAVDPQAVLLLSNSNTQWQALLTPAVAGDETFLNYYNLQCRAFQQSLGRLSAQQRAADLARAAAELPSLEEVQL